MQVEGQRGKSLLFLSATGARVRNAYTIYPVLGNSPKKFGLIPHSIEKSHGFSLKVSAVQDEYA